MKDETGKRMSVYNHELERIYSAIGAHFNNLLASWTIFEPGMRENDGGPEGWWALSNHEESIVAYFSRQEDAFRFRLAEINRTLNG
jgi:hypothetical protein